jgi:hypothetical protein
MKTGVAAILIASAIVAVPTVASADERVGDAALGALSGALVGGPIGAVAGGVIGFTAGPSISGEWFHRRRSKPRPPRYVQQAPQQW